MAEAPAEVRSTATLVKPSGGGESAKQKAYRAELAAERHSRFASSINVAGSEFGQQFSMRYAIIQLHGYVRLKACEPEVVGSPRTTDG